MCFGNNGFGGNCCLWIILLIIVLCCCCGNNGASENSNGCGCRNAELLFNCFNELCKLKYGKSFQLFDHSGNFLRCHFIFLQLNKF